MRTRSLVTRILIGIAAMALVGWELFLITQRDRWVSRAGVAREFGESVFFNQKETPIPSGLRALRSSEVSREQNGNKISLRWAESKENRKRAEVGRVPPRFTDDESQVVTLPCGGHIRLGWADMGYNPILKDFPAKEAFTPAIVTVRGDTWEALDGEAFRRFRTEELGQPDRTHAHRLTATSPGYISLDLTFLYEGLPDLRTDRVVRWMNLDTMSRIERDGGGGLVDPSADPLSPGRFHSRHALGVLYPARLAAGFDIAYGPCEEARLPLRPESRATLRDLEIEIIAIEPITSGQAIHFKEGAAQRTFYFDSWRTSRTRTSITFSLSAPELGRFCDVILVNRAGEQETIPLEVGHSLSCVATETRPEDLAEMILRYRPNQARVVFALPPLRGVPGINVNIDNLFDVTLPHYEATSASSLLRATEVHAQVRAALFHLEDPQFPEGYFPRFYENVTVRELLEEYLARHPQGSRIQLDRKTHALGIPKPFRWDNAWKDFRKWHGI